MPNNLLVLGAGPKGLALATKAAVLKGLGYRNVPAVICIEKEDIAANWRGQAGFTDGKQPLGTPPEKDVGFPYHSAEWGDRNRQVDDAMLRYSWYHYKALGDSAEPLSTWVDRGRLQPTHHEWGSYLGWVARQVDLQTRQGEAKLIDVTEGDEWEITYASRQKVRGIGLVITGPGAPKQSTNERIFNPVTFWTAGDRFQGKGLDVCVIGTGETSGAIVAALMGKLALNSRVFVVSPRAFIYSRGESFVENRVYSDPSNWEEVASEHRREFIGRTDRGVFSRAVQDRITGSAIPVVPLPGRADLDNIEIAERGGVLVKITYEGSERQYSFDSIIDAASMERTWFLSLMTPRAKRKLSECLKDLLRDRGFAGHVEDMPKGVLEETVDFHLRVRSLVPSLHIPMLAAFRRGPGFPNLSCLGMLSDRILKCYVRPPGRLRRK